jgi:hypothetical protein
VVVELMRRAQVVAALRRVGKALGRAAREFIARGQMGVHECSECRHVMPSQRRDWHRGVRRWYTMIGETRSWE